jgi:hypothetical protein
VYLCGDAQKKFIPRQQAPSPHPVVCAQLVLALSARSEPTDHWTSQYRQVSLGYLQ